MKFKVYLVTACCVLLAACGSSKAPNSAATWGGGASKGDSAPIKSTTSTSSTKKTGGAYLSGDGPADQTPENLENIPDAVPKVEPLHPYANRPYKALGRQYTPLTSLGSYRERGVASWYGKKFHGQATSSGEPYDMFGMTAAHPTLPIPSYVRVTHVANRKSVVVRINDRGPFLRERVIDLSYTAAHKLGLIGSGSSEVEVVALLPGVAEGTLLASNDLPAESVQTSTLKSANRVQTTSLATDAAVGGLGDNKDLIQSGKVFLQLGAFKVTSGAEAFMSRMRDQLSDENKSLILHQKDELVRVYIGPYADHQDARQGIRRLENVLGFKPVLSLP